MGMAFEGRISLWSRETGIEAANELGIAAGRAEDGARWRAGRRFHHYLALV